MLLKGKIKLLYQIYSNKLFGFQEKKNISYLKIFFITKAQKLKKIKSIKIH